jgi:hypothetical protein
MSIIYKKGQNFSPAKSCRARFFVLLFFFGTPKCWSTWCRKMSFPALWCYIGEGLHKTDVLKPTIHQRWQNIESVFAKMPIKLFPGFAKVVG